MTPKVFNKMADQPRQLAWRMFFGAQDRLALSDAEVLPMLEQDSSAPQAWLAFPQLSGQRMETLTKVADIDLFLGILLPGQSPAEWIRTTNRAFNRQSAADYMQQGGMEAVSNVWNYLGRHCGHAEGVPAAQLAQLKIAQARRGDEVIRRKQAAAIPPQK